MCIFPKTPDRWTADIHFAAAVGDRCWSPQESGLTPERQERTRQQVSQFGTRFGEFETRSRWEDERCGHGLRGT